MSLVAVRELAAAHEIRAVDVPRATGRASTDRLLRDPALHALTVGIPTTAPVHFYALTDGRWAVAFGAA